MTLKKKSGNVLLGAAFLMATAAIGPGFITQTTVFTDQLRSSFGFVILVSVLLDLAVQLNTWRIVGISGQYAQVIANRVLPGTGYLLAMLVVVGGLAFNIGNIAGAGLGLNVLFGINTKAGACISAVLALVLFWSREAGRAMDTFTKCLGFVMIGLTLFVVFQAHPPLADAIHRSFLPLQVNSTAIITLVGGTVGGYISFAGAHRMLDGGISGTANTRTITRGSITGILLASLMRILLFLAALGVVTAGGILNPANPAASVFSIAAGPAGYRIFGIVLWSAAITSVAGSAYTSISFIRGFHPVLEKNHRQLTTAFILISLLVFLFVGRPVKLLVAAGALNGLLLPFALGLLLVAVLPGKKTGAYQHPVWLSVAGWLVVVIIGAVGIRAMLTDLPALWH